MWVVLLVYEYDVRIHVLNDLKTYDYSKNDGLTRNDELRKDDGLMNELKKDGLIKNDDRMIYLNNDPMMNGSMIFWAILNEEGSKKTTMMMKLFVE